jgi:tetratricopeptide (TPR) repeat protein
MQAAIRYPSVVALVLAAVALLAGGCQKTDTDAAADAALAQTQALNSAIAAANRQLGAGQTGPGIAALEALSAAHPERLDVVEALAFAYSSTGDDAKAAPLFIEVAARNPQRRALSIYAAGIYADAGDHPNAIQQYRTYLDYFPHDAAAWKDLAQEYDAVHQTRPALNAYLESVQWTPTQEPTAADALDIARLHLRLGDEAQAEKWFHEALAHEPDSPTAAQARFGLLELALEQNQFAAATQFLADIDADPAGRATLDHAALAAARASVRENTRPAKPAAPTPVAPATPAAPPVVAVNTPAAPAAPNPAVVPPPAPAPTPAVGNTTSSPAPTAPLPPTVAANTPSMATPAIPAATATTEPSTPVADDSADTDNADTLAVEPPPPPETPAAKAAPLLADAKKAHDEGRDADAIKAYWKALALDETPADTWLALAQAYFDNKQYSEAASTSQEAIRRAPDNPAYTVFYLQVVKAAQPVSRYQSELNAAYEKFPADADIAFALADSFKDSGDRHDAALVYTDFIQRNPTDPRRPDAEAALSDLIAK